MKQSESLNDFISFESLAEAIINTNRSAYEMAVKRSKDAKKQRDEIKEATREINALKTEMQEIKSLLLKLANTP